MCWASLLDVSDGWGTILTCKEPGEGSGYASLQRVASPLRIDMESRDSKSKTRTQVHRLAVVFIGCPGKRENLVLSASTHPTGLAPQVGSPRIMS